MKTCSKCQQSKELTEFHKSKGGMFGVRADCKICNRNRVKVFYYKNPKPYILRAAEHNKRNPEKKKACDRRLYEKRMQDPVIRKAERERLARWKRENRKTEAARWMAYQCRKTKATPLWADLTKIKQIYLNCPEGYEVDHVIPLHGKTVSGLHVETNLQYLTRSENAAKGNKLVGAV